MVSSLFIDNVVVQTVIFLVSSSLLILLTRSFAEKMLSKTKNNPTNVSALIGKRAIVTNDINPTLGTGQVVVQGEHWSAKSDSNIEKGTEVTFLPSPNTFPNTVFDFDVLEQWLREQSYLNANVKIVLEDLRGGEKVTREFFSTDGLRGFALYLDKSKEVLNKEPIQIIKNTNDGMYVEVVLQWTTAYSENALYFTNNIPNRDGGVHMAGFRAGLTRAVNKYIADKFPKTKDANFSGEDFREGLTSIVSVKMPDPKFSSQTKDKLVSSEIRPIVESAVSEMLYEFMDENPSIAKTIGSSCG